MPYYNTELDENNLQISINVFETHRHFLINELKNETNLNTKEKSKLMNQLKNVERIISMLRDFSMKYLTQHF
jgi:hypothetical protein